MKKLISIFSVMVVFIIIPCLALYYCGFTSFLDNFFENQMIPLMGTIMALNFATAASLQAILFSIEDKVNKNFFLSTRNEIKQNIVFIIIVFIIAFILQIIKTSNILCYLLMGIKLLLFFVYFYAIYDLNQALFSITKNNKE